MHMCPAGRVCLLLPGESSAATVVVEACVGLRGSLARAAAPWFSEIPCTIMESNDDVWLSAVCHFPTISISEDRVPRLPEQWGWTATLGCELRILT